MTRLCEKFGFVHITNKIEVAPARGANRADRTLRYVKITKEILDLAKHIVQQNSEHFDPDKFDDHYEAALSDLLLKQQNGQPIVKIASRTSGNVIDIMDALREF
jgi:DNA end-binding protein Ku